MKKILSAKTWLYAALLYVCFAVPAWSQTGFDDDVEDEPAEAPINQLLIIGFIGGSILAYQVIRKKKHSI
ncbi:hypothetical protein AAEO56_13270 [Flavobacterium sp. DGU11]|uniref:PEP-CTERM protein-sorting domain-containing protein n=1 Tax=Flavobacterium arundinis TaxID=3139143 RepID=A0ABU9HYM4_9FLAO